MLDHHVEHVAVHDQITPAVGGLVDRGLDHVDAAEMGAVIVAQELVVIAGQIDDARALARLAQQLLHHVVMVLRPEPAGAQLPAVDDVADQINGLGIVIAQKADELIGLATARAEMHIGNKESTEFGRTVLDSHRHDSRDVVVFESASRCVALQNHDKERHR